MESKRGKSANTQSLYSSQGVTQVNIPAATGDMGILANHVPSVEALKAGIVEVIEDAGAQSKKWFSEWIPTRLRIAGVASQRRKFGVGDVRCEQCEGLWAGRVHRRGHGWS